MITNDFTKPGAVRFQDNIPIPFLVSQTFEDIQICWLQDQELYTEADSVAVQANFNLHSPFGERKHKVHHIPLIKNNLKKGNHKSHEQKASQIMYSSE